MKSEVMDIKSKGTYPCLKIVKDSLGVIDIGTIVLFNERGHGIVVFATGSHIIGEYNKAWAEDQCFIPFSGKVILEND